MSNEYVFKRLPRKAKKRMKRELCVQGKICYVPNYEDGVFVSLWIDIYDIKFHERIVTR